MPNEDKRHQHRQQELQERAASDLERTAAQRASSEGPAMDVLAEMDADELWENLTGVDVESSEYESIVSVLKPYLSSGEMLANHGDDYYDDRKRRLLNENLADRIILGREYNDLCTGVFREVAQDVDGDNFDGQRRDWSPAEKEAIRVILEELRTDRQSLGDGTLLRAIMETHVSTERRGAEQPSKSGGLSSLLPWK
ncbi:hypothetical protein E6P09_09540 [Haloferax mediterranei ATCC 33500]|uniref:Uncharacterized protein n=1 Tax=Haloferax mediterranei (strain ATCC 33500 / DSM 1411 / JCM 8866 / NBRC 14739 / NCIMB 2177 / R-4) TaxID=523841 RepID=I3R458_HALMT|nr:hypothetical protein [Haloferax mediterranei]AFK19018.1 hypothetical protein HFX_1306 [Haloferax mediterranei ATCC 33500]AHZ21623.1 hypothetical protein BM92_02655 [Haloferax mediterranei ATCC 33500]EMA03540.1 hypothetical protein C439_03975 [Haloferax mediterranei ATCC 33500]MDX5989111.1 hypothetical protein [Haloferax mediterranei ATCC 33500]QCQ75494.1 hypothetical protein E6P09_09540 [Haloferax mediterranei ATCC 33500]